MRIFSSVKRFAQIILEKNPQVILGIANYKGNSQSEAVAINQFHKSKMIDKSGPKKFDLSKIPGFPISPKSSDSFCNWTAYKMSRFSES